MEEHNWLGYAHLFQPDKWMNCERERERGREVVAAKIHVTLIFTRVHRHQGFRDRLSPRCCRFYEMREHFWYRLLAIIARRNIPLLTLNTPLFSLSLFSFFVPSSRREDNPEENFDSYLSIYD